MGVCWQQVKSSVPGDDSLTELWNSAKSGRQATLRSLGRFGPRAVNRALQGDDDEFQDQDTKFESHIFNIDSAYQNIIPTSSIFKRNQSINCNDFSLLAAEIPEHLRPFVGPTSRTITAVLCEFKIFRNRPTSEISPVL